MSCNSNEYLLDEETDAIEEPDTSGLLSIAPSDSPNPQEFQKYQHQLKSSELGYTHSYGSSNFVADYQCLDAFSQEIIQQYPSKFDAPALPNVKLKTPRKEVAGIIQDSPYKLSNVSHGNPGPQLISCPEQNLNLDASTLSELSHQNLTKKSPPSKPPSDSLCDKPVEPCESISYERKHYLDALKPGYPNNFKLYPNQLQDNNMNIGNSSSGSSQSILRSFLSSPEIGKSSSRAISCDRSTRMSVSFDEEENEDKEAMENWLCFCTTAVNTQGMLPTSRSTILYSPVVSELSKEQPPAASSISKVSLKGIRGRSSRRSGQKPIVTHDDVHDDVHDDDYTVRKTRKRYMRKGPTCRGRLKESTVIDANETLTQSDILKTKFTKSCWTCRLRRKKCDMATPFCKTCSDLGITCMGFQPGKLTQDSLRDPEKSKSARAAICETIAKRKSTRRRRKHRVNK